MTLKKAIRQKCEKRVLFPLLFVSLCSALVFGFEIRQQDLSHTSRFYPENKETKVNDIENGQSSLKKTQKKQGLEDYLQQNSTPFLKNQTLSEKIQKVQSRLLLESCSIASCVACVSINNTELCLACQYPKLPTLSMDSCYQSIFENDTSRSCTIQKCQKCSVLSVNSSTPTEICFQCIPGFQISISHTSCVRITYIMKVINSAATGSLTDYENLFYICQQQGCSDCEMGQISQICEVCQDGYVLVNESKTCIKCAETCRSCNKQTPQICTSCYKGYSLSNSTCRRCSDSKCTSCYYGQNFQTCSECKDYFYPFLGRYCNPCTTKNCLTCDNDGKCSTCQNGYYLQASKNYSSCNPCVDGCYQCSNLTSCQKCFPGFYLNYNPQILGCLPCSSNCKQCYSSQYSSYYCRQCFQGFVNIKSKCFKPKSNCLLMDQTGDCILCINTFSIQSRGECVSNSLNKLSICNFNQFALNVYCLSCPQNFTNCLQCTNKACLKCVDGYFLSISNYTCQPCTMQGCQICTGPDICSICKDGYYLELTTFRDYERLGEIKTFQTCQRCDSNCKRCIIHSKYCLECKLSMNPYYYRRLNGFCDYQQTLKFKIVFDTNFSQFNSQVQSIKQDLAFLSGNLEYLPQRIKISDVKEGSVIVKGLILVDFVAIPDTISYFKLKFQSGNIASGLPVISSNIDWNFASDASEEVQTPNQQKKIEFILAVTISSGVVFIGVIVLIVCLCKKYKDKKVQEAQNQANQEQNQNVQQTQTNLLKFIPKNQIDHANQKSQTQKCESEQKVIGVKLYQKSQIIEKGLVKSSNEMMAQDNSPKGFESQTSVLKLHPKVQTDFVIEPTKMDENELNSFTSNKKTFCQIENVN